MGNGVIRERLPRRRLAEMISEALPGASLVAVRGVPTGSSALARELIVSSATSERCTLILRRFAVAWQGSPRSKVQREAVALSTLADSGLPVPRVVWSDPWGRVLGYPAILQIAPSRASVVATGGAAQWSEGDGCSSPAEPPFTSAGNKSSPSSRCRLPAPGSFLRSRG